MSGKRRVIELRRADRWWENGRGCTKFEVAKPLPTAFDERRYYTVRQVADLFSVRPDAIYEWVRVGRLPAQRLPGSRAIRFLGQQINETLARGQIREYADASVSKGK